MKEDVTFIIPAFNDALTIELVVQKSVAVAKQLHISYSLLIINDASSDNTGSILKKLKKTIPKLSVITHTTNAGFGRTIKELYEKANHSWLFSVPGDYQIDPAELLVLWKHKDEADMIIGRRINRIDPPQRLLQSKIYNGLLRFLFGLPFHDVNSARLMRKQIINTITLTSTSAFVDAELCIKALRSGFRIIEIPIRHRARTGDGAGGGKLATIMPTIKDIVVFFNQT